MHEPIDLTVNGRQVSVRVPPRTQLAEILRDELDLTGTHLGCEQGVCGACTVLFNGKPVRSCITFAGSCDGAEVETIEGFAEDPIMDLLKTAFSRHHALQCGFCTPGMLTTARDIVVRFGDPDETTIRRELSGNLCRCTGYMGIVAAIRDVIAQRNGLSLKADEAAVAASPRAFAPFEAISSPTRRSAPSAATVATDGNWTIVERAFELPHPSEEVWALFSDIGSVASCVPGAAIDTVTADRFTGAVEVRFGPIRASIGGEGSFRNDDDNRSGAIEAQGDDKRGRSKARGRLNYAVERLDDSRSTVKVAFRFQIEGMLAQFNRPELVTAFVDYLLGQFVKNCNARLSGGTVAETKGISAFRLGMALVWSRIRSLLPR